MADSEDFSLLSSLKTRHPNVPITVVLKVMNKFQNDEEKCNQALALESEKRSNASDGNSDTSPTVPVADSINNNQGSSGDLFGHMKELQVSHDENPQGKQERHVSTIERSVGNASRPSDQKRTLVGQSVSWTVQPTDKPVTTGAQGHGSRAPSNSMNTPQTAPPDFTPFFTPRLTKGIPNIDCQAHVTSGGTSQGGRPQHIAVNSSQASYSPGEQRRPVKVINIPPGALSGGSVSPAATPPNRHHIRMHFGDTGGVCSVSRPLTSMQHFGSSPNISQHYRSEFRTESASGQPVHSSSIVVNTTNHSNHPVPERKQSSNSGNDSFGNGRRTPNPPLSLNTAVCDSQSISGMSNAFSTGRPLSTPVQASSPGTSHSKPVFVEIKKDHLHGGYGDANNPSDFYSGNNIRPPPQNSNSFYNPVMNFPMAGPLSYPQYHPDYSGSSGFSLSQPQQEQQYPQQQKHPGYTSPPTNYQSTSGAGYDPNSYPHHNRPTNFMVYPAMGVTGPLSMIGHGTVPPHYFGHQGGQYSSGMHMPKSPNVGVPQPTLSSRSNSQDSEHSVGAEYDGRHHHFNNMGSRVSSLSSVSSDSSIRADRMDQGNRPRSGSIQDEDAYIRALLQHQRSRMQKLKEDMSQHTAILDNLRSDVGLMEKNMIENSRANKSFPSVEDISRLCERNRSLQTDIQMYMNEIDMYKSGQTPFNNINPRDQQNFFENMPTGQRDPIYSIPSDGNRSSSPSRSPPPRPPPPIPVRQRSTDAGQASGGGMSASDILRVPPVPPAQPTIHSGDSEEGDSWSCSACTFSNHPALKKCEMCEMPRVMPPHPASSAGPPAIPPHMPLSSLPPRLAPSVGMSNMQPRPGLPPSAFGHHHRAGT